jgi:hypothetical protein
MGFRNPFRFSLRPGTGNPNPAAADPGTLYIGDVGWANWEELSVVPNGGLSVQDIFDFLAGYFGGDLRADFNGNGANTTQDIFDFLTFYFLGC